MSIHLIAIGKQKFVCGLFWQSLSRPRELALEARALAHKIDADLLVLRRDHTMAQAGYAHTRDGARGGQASLACAVAHRLVQDGAHYNGQRQAPHNWLAAFQLPDGLWAYLAVRDANFLPSGDFAASREEVLERLHGDYALGGWNVVIGEPELEQFGFHDFQARTLDQLLGPRKGAAPRWARLRAAQRKRPRPLWLAGAAVVAVLVLAAVLYQRRQAALARLQQAQALLAVPKPAPPPPPVPPWHAQAAPADLVQRCLAQLRHLAPGGWVLDRFECSAGAAMHTWRRGDSNIGLLLAAVPHASVDAGGEVATLTEPLAAGSPRTEPLMDGGAARRALQSTWQQLGLRGQLADRPAPLPPPGTNAPPPPPWKTIALNVGLDQLAPRALPAMLEQPGLRLEKITYRAGTWTLEGVLYVQ